GCAYATHLVGGSTRDGLTVTRKAPARPRSQPSSFLISAARSTAASLRTALGEPRICASDSLDESNAAKAITSITGYRARFTAPPFRTSQCGLGQIDSSWFVYSHARYRHSSRCACLQARR